MSARKRLQVTEVGQPKRKSWVWHVQKSHQSVSPEFNHNRVLLRRYFFINEEKTRYISFEFYSLYRLSFQDRNLMENKSDITCDLSKDIGPQIMEHRPNSKSDTSADISRAESHILSLTEHCVLIHAINQWTGSKYVTYRTNGSHLRSFIIHDWPHFLEPEPSALRDAGFFFTGKIRTIF